MRLWSALSNYGVLEEFGIEEVQPESHAGQPVPSVCAALFSDAPRCVPEVPDTAPSQVKDEAKRAAAMAFG